MKAISGNKEGAIRYARMNIAGEVVRLSKLLNLQGAVKVTIMPREGTVRPSDQFEEMVGQGYADSTEAPIGRFYCTVEDGGFEDLLGLTGLKTASILRTNCDDSNEKIPGESIYPGKRLIQTEDLYIIIGLTTNRKSENEEVINQAVRNLDLNNLTLENMLQKHTSRGATLIKSL